MGNIYIVTVSLKHVFVRLWCYLLNVNIEV